MFTIVITEKGGSQRRLDFDQEEITIGRVQGNDIILPKGNVSKRHSRILRKDGHFVVADMKSTNGTYVNGRRISQPLVLKGADKIYVGDFIITVEGEGAIAPSSARSQPPPPPPGGSPRRPSQAPPAPPLPSAPKATPSPPPLPSAASPSSMPPPRTGVEPLLPEAEEDSVVDAAILASEPPEAARRRMERRDPTPLESLRPEPPAAPAKRAPAVQSRAESPAPGALERSLSTLMPRVADRFDVYAVDPRGEADPKRKSEARRMIEAEMHGLGSEGLLEATIDPPTLVELALKEAVGLGPLEGLVDDRDVCEIVVEGPRKIHVDAGQGLEDTGRFFSGREAIATVARRLAARAGETLDATRPFREVVLPWGAAATLVLPPVASRGPIIEVRRLQPSPTISELVATETLSQEVAELLARSAAARRNIAVIGPRGPAITALVGAIASLSDRRDRVLTLSSRPDLVLSRDHVFSLWTGGPGSPLGLAQLIGEATVLRCDRCVIDGIVGAEMLEALSAAATLGGGCILGIHSPNERGARDSIRTLALLRRPIPENALDTLIARAIHLLVEVEGTSGGVAVTAVHEVVRTAAGVDTRPIES